MYVEIDGDPFVVYDHSSQTPSARGAATLIKVKLRNLRSRQMVNRTFKASDRIKEADFEIRSCQYIYEEGGETYYFMDEQNYEQFPVARADIEQQCGYILPGDQVQGVFFEGQVIGIQVPNTVVLEVTECEPAVKGNTVSNVTKSAALTTGLEVQVPLFVSPGDRLVIDTRDGHYVRRA
jgi:elongation factor P